MTKNSIKIFSKQVWLVCPGPQQNEPTTKYFFSFPGLGLTEKISQMGEALLPNQNSPLWFTMNTGSCEESSETQKVLSTDFKNPLKIVTTLKALS